ncbi:MAG: hypothetical protein AAF382_11335 [Pseudomonadota bacterium]
MTQIHIQPLTALHADTAFALTTKVFAQDSTLHAALGTDLETYRQTLRPNFDAMVAEGLSFVALDGAKRCLGAILATDLVLSTSDKPAHTAVAALTRDLTQTYLHLRRPQIGEALLVDMAAIRRDARGRGIYPALRHAVHAHARDLGWRYVVGELSSPATQHVVLTQMGHTKIAEIAFADFEWQGTRPFQSIVSPPSIILAEGRL